MDTTTTSVTPSAHFDRQYQLHLKHLKLKGLQPKTIDAYARAVRRIGAYFAHDIDSLSEHQLTEYFSDLIATHSWSAVKLDLYGLKFYATHADVVKVVVASWNRNCLGWITWSELSSRNVTGRSYASGSASIA